MATLSRLNTVLLVLLLRGPGGHGWSLSQGRWTRTIHHQQQPLPANIFRWTKQFLHTTQSFSYSQRWQQGTMCVPYSHSHPSPPLSLSSSSSFQQEQHRSSSSTMPDPLRDATRIFSTTNTSSISSSMNNKNNNNRQSSFRITRHRLDPFEISNNNNEEISSPSSVTSTIEAPLNDTTTMTLWSYVTSIQLARRQWQHQQQFQPLQQRSSCNRKDLDQELGRTYLKATRSLIHYLQQQSASTCMMDDQHATNIEGPLHRAIIQSIRLSAAVRDYHTIFQLLTAVQAWASNVTTVTTILSVTEQQSTSTTKTKTSLLLLDPRLVGEAVMALAQNTTANLAKIKAVWNTLWIMDDNHTTTTTRTTRTHAPLINDKNIDNNNSSHIQDLYLRDRHHNYQRTWRQIWCRPAGPNEVNAMIQALTWRGKTRAVLNLYQQAEDRHAIDAYSISLVIKALIGSSLFTIPELETPCRNSMGTPPPPPTDQQPVISMTSCWQWQAAMDLFQRFVDLEQQQQQQDNKAKEYGNSIFINDTSKWSPVWMNNHVMTSFLQLNEKIGLTLGPTIHDTSIFAIKAIQYMADARLKPDVITCKLLLSCLGQTSWQASVDLLRSIQHQYQEKDVNDTIHNSNNRRKDHISNSNGKHSWPLIFPRPNGYMYSAVMTACAKHGEYPTAVALLRDIQQSPINQVHPVTFSWLYNSVLHSLMLMPRDSSINSNRTHRRMEPQPGKVGKNHLKQQLEQRDHDGSMLTARKRWFLAWALFVDMKSNTATDMGSAPCTTTYNTLIAVLRSIVPHLQRDDWLDWQREYPRYATHRGDIDMDDGARKCVESLVSALLDDMITETVPRDTTTYRHAIQMVTWVMESNGNSMLQNDPASLLSSRLMKLLDQFMDDVNPSDNRRTVGVCNETLFFFAKHGHIDALVHVLIKMNQRGVPLNTISIHHTITALANAQRSRTIPVLLLALTGNQKAINHLVTVHGLGLDVDQLSSLLSLLDANLCVEAVNACITAGDLDSAQRVQVLIHELQLELDDTMREGIATTQAMFALRNTKLGLKTRQRLRNIPPAKMAALSAVQMIRQVEKPTMAALAQVVRASFQAGLIFDAQSLLRLMHVRILDRRDNDEATVSMKQIVTHVHSGLLSFCSSVGNVTNALRICEDIQYFASQLATRDALLGCQNKIQTRLSYVDTSTYAITKNLTPDELHMHTSTGSMSATRTRSHNLEMGMSLADWTCLLVAASRSGHWKVCLNTLQFIRPYLEAIHPSKLHDEKPRSSSLINQEYRQLGSALNAAIKCLVLRGQYAWCIRTIDDWMEWGGRKPPKGAVRATVQLLAARRRTDEINTLLLRCTMGNNTSLTVGSLTTSLSSSLSAADGAYAASLYAGAISALHHEGMYDAADDLFITAVAQGWLPLDLERKSFGVENRIILDLHGMNVAMAHSAVRLALQNEFLSVSWNRTEICGNDLVIVTGRGRNSVLKMRPVIRPEVQRMLMEEFYPPLSSTSVKGNMGALRVSQDSIAEWLLHQQEQKGARMLNIAALLKNLSSGERLQAALAKAVEHKNNEVK